MLSMWFKRWLRNWAEKLSNSFYEDINPPPIFAYSAEVYGRKERTQEEWQAFAVSVAEQAYRTGYVRGVEYTERSDWWRSDIPPEAAAEMQDKSWMERPVGADMDIAPEIEVEPTNENDVDLAIKRSAVRG